MLKKRRITAFSLSFLDIMACGFGAVTLLFLILRHSVVVEVQPDAKLSAEVEMLKKDVEVAEQERSDLLNSIEDLELQLVNTQGLSTRYLTELQEVEESIQSDPEERIAKDIAAKASVCHPERQVIGSPPCRSRHRNA